MGGRAAAMSRCCRAPSVRCPASIMPDHSRGSPSAGPCPVSRAHSRVSWPGSSSAAPGSTGCRSSATRASAVEQYRSMVFWSAPVSRRRISPRARFDSSRPAGLSGTGAGRLTRTCGCGDGSSRAADPSWPRSSTQPRSRGGTGSTRRRSDTSPLSWPWSPWKPDILAMLSARRAYVVPWSSVTVTVPTAASTAALIASVLTPMTPLAASHQAFRAIFSRGPGGAGARDC
jgi:hypothetical protein